MCFGEYVKENGWFWILDDGKMRFLIGIRVLRF